MRNAVLSKENPEQATIEQLMRDELVEGLLYEYGNDLLFDARRYLEKKIPKAFESRGHDAKLIRVLQRGCIKLQAISMLAMIGNPLYLGSLLERILLGK